MMKRQGELNLHCLTGFELYKAFEEGVESSHITAERYKKILVGLKLLKSESAQSIYWNRFYEKFVTAETIEVDGEETDRVFYDIQNILLGTVMLCGDEIKEKSYLIYFILDFLQEKKLTVDNLMKMFTIFAVVSVNFLPFLASDYPSDNKAYYFKLF
jgi:hypothetical protein